MNYLVDLQKQGKIGKGSVVKVKTCPSHKGSFFSGWHRVEVDGITMQVFGSTPGQLGSEEANKRVSDAITDYLRGTKEFPPQAKPV